jgi:hypothetical protein
LTCVPHCPDNLPLGALIAAILVSVLIVAGSVLLVVIFVLRKKRKHKKETQNNPPSLIQEVNDENKSVVLPLPSPRPNRKTAEILANIKDLESTFAIEGCQNFSSFLLIYSFFVTVVYCFFSFYRCR